MNNQIMTEQFQLKKKPRRPRCPGIVWHLTVQAEFRPEFGAASFRNPLVRAWCGPGAALVLIKAAPK